MSLLSRLPAGLLLACALLLSVPARAEPSVTQYFHDLQSLQAGFTQRVSDAQGRIVQESAGSMAMQKPGRFRWDYTAPSPQTIVADGQRLWVHDPGLDQVRMVLPHHLGQQIHPLRLRHPESRHRSPSAAPVRSGPTPPHSPPAGS